MYPGDIQKTAIATPFGLFEFHLMSFGLHNTIQTFLRFMEGILWGLDFCFAYLDDNLPDHSRTTSDIYWGVFGRLQTYGILINPVKCVFRASKVIFLGYKASSDGSQPLEERLVHLQDCPHPKTASQLRRLLNFYRRFMP
jgi:hypothetical protein